MTINSPGGSVVDADLEHDALRDIYATVSRIAAIGASANEAKEAHTIPAYLASQGYQVTAVSPRPGTLFGNPVASSLADVPGPIDVVDVFRPPEEAERVVDAAIAAGAPILWFQPGTDTDAAVQRAAAAGLTVISKRCMGATHKKLGLTAV